jgi:hypothetical protein
MHKRPVLALLVIFGTLSLSADQTPAFYFGGKRLFVGMTKAEAVAVLSACCQLSPPADSENAKLAPDAGKMLGHFIVSKDDTPRFFGSIFFADGKVARITRLLDADKFDPLGDDVVAFARTLDRSLATETTDSHAVFISTRHERLSNGEGEVLTFSFPNGRAVELQISTLDTPSKETGKRDAVGLDEILQSPRW